MSQELRLLDYYAAAALQGLLAQDEWVDKAFLANEAFEIALKMLEIRTVALSVLDRVEARD